MLVRRQEPRVAQGSKRYDPDSGFLPSQEHGSGAIVESPTCRTASATALHQS